jgi:genome maintenance exonuclease 1
MSFVDPVMGIDPRSLVPGAMREQITRDTLVGVVEFEQAPAGWLAKNGKPRRKDWRAYYLTGEDEKRRRMTSVTTLLDAITAKGGLVVWSERIAVRDALEAVRRGVLDPAAPLEPRAAIDVLKANGLGADAEKGKAATRGLNLHALLEEYLRTGTPPDPSAHPEPHRGYIRALAGFLTKYDPEPVLIEHIVACPEHGYAGRLDLVARVEGLVGLWDLKTQENAGIYSSAHVQCAMYRRGLRDSDDMEVSTAQVVALAADGGFRVMPCAATDSAVDAALAWYRHLSPIESACDAQNRIEKEARRARSGMPRATSPRRSARTASRWRRRSRASARTGTPPPCARTSPAATSRWRTSGTRATWRRASSTRRSRRRGD